MPHLEICRDHKLVKRYPVVADVVTIGRGGITESVLPSPGKVVSRYHAAIVRGESGDYFIRDLASVNGTQVHRRPAYRRWLRDLDTIKIGEYDLRFFINDMGSDDTVSVLSEDEWLVDSEPDFASTRPLLQGMKPGPELTDEKRQRLGDVLHRCLVKADSPEFHQELLNLVVSALRAGRGVLASVRDDGKIVVLCHAGLEPDRGEQVQINRDNLESALLKRRLLIGRSMRGRSRIYAPLLFDHSRTRFLYLESGSGVRFDNHDIDFIRLLFESLSTALLNRRSRADLGARQRTEGSSFKWRARVIGNTREMTDVRRRVRVWAMNDANILLLGDTGVGKGLIARQIHDLSPRSGGPFVMVELPAKANEVLESELFGHEKGSFTGAVGRRGGAFEAAQGGTLFLDEIGDISQEMQGKLRHAIEDRIVYRVGSTEPTAVDVRVICATNRNLVEDVDQGRFRRDLYERLGTTIKIPSLRERKADIPLLLHYFIDELGTDLEGVAHGVLLTLLAYPWPGNARELKRLVTESAASGEAVLFDWNLPEQLKRSLTPPDDVAPVQGALRQTEDIMIRDALRRHQGNKTAAAAELGITRQTLYAKMKKYGIG
jgi:Nif-specific regulatory protein